LGVFEWKAHSADRCPAIAAIDAILTPLGRIGFERPHFAVEPGIFGKIGKLIFRLGRGDIGGGRKNLEQVPLT
jgi:hypothetical protein